MSAPTVPITNEQLRAVWAEQPTHAVAFEVALQTPALVIAMRNTVEARERRRAQRPPEPDPCPPPRRAAAPPAAPMPFSGKRAAANDRDDQDDA